MSRIYSATYSNVPVYEFNVEGNHVMRRRADHWINATHILKVAGYDKPARTRILEREVQKGQHEKVQGGYGKYQGTWISLEDGRYLAERNNCLDKLLPIFDFRPGDRSPPPAPKHMTAQTAKPKGSRAMAPPRRVPVPPPQPRASEVSFDYSSQVGDDDQMERSTLASEDESTMFPGDIRWPTASRKRKRGMREPPQPPQMSQEDQRHLMWSDELLDYFMLQRSDDPAPPAPEPPDGIDLNRPVDEKGNTALHWAAAMGDLQLVQTFIQRGADINVLTNLGATPLIHAVTFTNNFDKTTMSRLADHLYSTVGQRDCCASTVFHHIAASTMSKSKYKIARYYLQELLDKLKQVYEPHDIARLLDLKDENGNTATLLAAKNGARRCVRIMTSEGASVDILNNNGETAEQYILELNERRRDRHRQLSSSPVLPPNGLPQIDGASSQLPPLTGLNGKGSQYISEAASSLTAQLPSLIQSRTEALATALETELAEREADVKEGERLLEQRKQELHAVRKQLVSLTTAVEQSSQAETQTRELQLIEEESHRLIEDEHDIEIKQSLSRNRISSQHTASETGQTAQQSLAERWRLARQLAALQNESKTLIDDTVTAQSFAGVSDERHDAYKRLIMKALDVRAEDVDPMLDEMLQELEEARAARAEQDQDVDMLGQRGSDGVQNGATAPVRMAMPATNVGAGLKNADMVYAPVQVAG